MNYQVHYRHDKLLTVGMNYHIKELVNAGVYAIMSADALEGAPCLAIFFFLLIRFLGAPERHQAPPKLLRAAKLSASARALSMALALLTVSWYSASGVESLTQPPPACT